MIKTKVFQRVIIFSLFLIFLCIAFWPAISSYYAYHDDVIFFLRTSTRPEAPGTLFNLSIGRFIGAHLYMAMGFLINSIDDLKGVRFLGVVNLAFCALILFFWLRKKFFSSRNAFLLSLAVFTLPSFQIAVSQTAMTYQPVSILFAIGAFSSAYRISLSDKIVRRIFNGRFVLSVFLFFCALSTYKPTAMFYWTMAGLVVLFSEFKDFSEIKNRMINLFSPAIVSLGLYVLVLRLIKPYFSRFNLWGYNPYALTTDYFGKIGWFLREPLVNALNLWNIFPYKIAAAVGVTFVISAIALEVLRQQKEERIEFFINGFVRSSILIILSLLSFLPNLVSSQSIFYYRCAGPLTVLVFFIFIWSARAWIQFIFQNRQRIVFSIALLLLSFYGVVQAHQTILNYRVVPSQKEIQFVKDQMAKVNINEYEKIYFVQPEERYLKNRGDEFGNLTTVYSHNMVGLVSCLLREVAKGTMEVFHINFDPSTKMVLYIFRDINDEKQMYRYQIKVDSGVASEKPSSFQEKTLVIDMRRFEDREEGT
ncbi:MAG: hypothetical protein P9M12_03215 [Candidatus Aceula lacicola]|nr:hypothetical protein [Candidatus Aceula lacicola]